MLLRWSKRYTNTAPASTNNPDQDNKGFTTKNTGYTEIGLRGIEFPAGLMFPAINWHTERLWIYHGEHGEVRDAGTRIRATRQGSEAGFLDIIPP